MHDIAQAAADAAQVPDFGAIARRGERRRNIRTGVIAGGAALAVASIIGLGQLVGADSREEPEPAPSPPTTVIESEQSTAEGPERIIEHDDALVADAAVTEEGAAAVFWSVPDQVRWALAVSDDAFATRGVHGLGIPGDVTSAGDRFLVRDQARSRLWLVDPAGERTKVVIDGPEAPIGQGEIPTGMGTALVAVDPLTATAHPVPVPEGTYDVGTYGGRLAAVGTYNDGSGQVTGTYYWSDDGGAHWQTTSFDADWRWDPIVVPSAAGTEHVIAMSGDSADLGPLVAVLTMPAAGGGFATTEYVGELATIAGAFVVDGEVRFLGDLWGTGTRPRESGIYRWADGQLERMPSSAPEVTDADDSTLMDVVDTDGGPTLLVAVGDRLFRSTDGGGAWEELAAR